jgi:hypothetical protein
MSTARHYRTRPAVPVEVAAVQWTGSNIAEMEALLGSCFSSWEGGASILTTEYCSWEDLYEGDWAALGPGGVVERLSAEKFAARFEAVGDA